MPSLTTASTRPTTAHNALCQLAERMGTEATTDDARALQAWALANDVDLNSATPDAFLAAIDAALAAPVSQTAAPATKVARPPTAREILAAARQAGMNPRRVGELNGVPAYRIAGSFALHTAHDIGRRLGYAL